MVVHGRGLGAGRGHATGGGPVLGRPRTVRGGHAAAIAAYAWLYAKNRSKIARVDEETSLLSQTEENPFGPNGLEITKF